MKRKIFHPIFYLFFAIASCVSFQSKCKMIKTDNDEYRVYSCVEATLSDIEDVPDIVEQVRFSVSKLPQIPAKAFARLGSNLRELSFFNCEIGHIDEDAFDGLEQLQQLTFHGNNIFALKASWFKDLSSLTYLFLDKNDLVYIEPNVFSLTPKLEYLNIEDNNLNCLSSDILSQFRKLKYIRIEKNPWLCGCYAKLEDWMRDRKINYGSKNAENECMMNQVKESRDSTLPFYTIFKNISVTETGYIEMNAAKDIRCVGNDISVLSRIPDNVKSIQFMNSQIPKIPQLAFLRFGNSLTSLHFRNCSIREIHPEAFAGLSKLETLFLFENSFGIVSTEWFRDLRSLSYLSLDKNGIEHISKDTFQLLNKLKYLSLSHNKMECISTDKINLLKHLKDVILSHNPWNCSCQTNLRKWLHEHRVRYVISRGSCVNGHIQETEDLFGQIFEEQEPEINTKTSGPTHGEIFSRYNHQERRIYDPTEVEASENQDIKIKLAETNHNQNIEISDSEYLCFLTKKYQHSDVKNSKTYTELEKTVTLNNCTELIDFDIKKLNDAKNLFLSPSVVEMKNSLVLHYGTIFSLISIPTSEITAIKYEYAVIPVIARGIFSRFSNTLQILEMSHCSIEIIDPLAFEGLINLRKLILNDNNIQMLKSEWFKEIPNLQVLNLARNSITRIDNSVFKILPKLETLDISNNKLTCVDMDLISYLNNLKTMNVGGNPWLCSCQRNLIKWLSKHEICNDVVASIIDRDCMKHHRSFETISKKTNCIEIERSAIKERIEYINNVQNLENYKYLETVISRRKSSKIIQLKDQKVNSNLEPFEIQKIISTPNIGESVHTNRYCNLYQYNPKSKNHWWCEGGDVSVFEQIPENAETIEIVKCNIAIIPANAFTRFSNLTVLHFYDNTIGDIHPMAFATLEKLEKLFFVNNSAIPIIKSLWFHDLKSVTLLGFVRNSVMQIDSDVFEYLPSLELFSFPDNNLRCLYTKAFSSLKQLRRVTMQKNPWKWRCQEELTQFFEARNISYVKSKNYEGERSIAVLLEEHLISN